LNADIKAKGHHHLDKIDMHFPHTFKSKYLKLFPHKVNDNLKSEQSAMKEVSLHRTAQVNSTQNNRDQKEIEQKSYPPVNFFLVHP
jgi:hypothetical protein